MKLYFNQLNQHLAKQLLPIYVISGDEALLRDEAVQTLCQRAEQAGFSETLRLTADRRFDWSQLLASAENRSLFAEKRIIICQAEQNKPGDKAYAALQEYAQRLIPDTVLILLLPKLDAAQLKNKWLKQLDNVGAILQLWPLTAEEFKPWLEKRLHEADLKLQPEAQQRLLSFTEGNLLAAQQAIEKLRLSELAAPISEEALLELLHDGSQYTVFDLVDSCLAGQAEKSLLQLSKLRSAGVAEPLILWSLCRELRSLIQLQFAKQSQPLASLWQQFRIWPKRQTLVKHALDRLSINKLYSLLNLAAKADLAIKGAITADSDLALQQICLRFCSKR